MFVSAYTLHDYPITHADVLVRGPEAWNVALNTINVCKYNLGWASIGICTHAFHEAIDHAGHRQLYGGLVTDFTHVRQLFVDAYARLTAMKLFAMRANDYMRSASDDDRRYLLYNPLVKMKVTTEGEHVINHLWDVAAKGFEADTYFHMAADHIRALPKLEGTVHVNIALIVKFMPNYFFAPQEYPEVPVRQDHAHDAYLFEQAPTRGLNKIRFHDWAATFDRFDSPNVTIFRSQVETFRDMLEAAAPDGLTFEPAGPRKGFEAWNRDAEDVEIADALVIRVATLDAVIDSKRAAGRPKDERALPYLESLRDERARQQD